MNINKQELKSAIIGMVIGDGCLSKKQKIETHNAYFQCSHSLNQFEYLVWKKEILERVSGCKITPNDKKVGDKIYKGYHLGSRTNPLYTKLYSRFYMYDKKSVDEYLVKMITPLALAIMYMDDGTLGKANPKFWTKETFYLKLCNFDYANLFLIKKSLRMKFNLDWNINQTSAIYKGEKRRYYQLRLLNRDNQKFSDIVRPYIERVPCMLYKLGSYANTSE